MPCGYQIGQAKKVINDEVEHRLVLGKNIAQVLPEIVDVQHKGTNAFGGGIDLLVLDTIHSLPGELLDYIVCLPFLSSNAVVILGVIWISRWHKGCT